VAQHFQPIADLVTPANGAPAHIDDLIRLLGEAYQELSNVSSGPAGGQALMLKRASEGVGADPVQQLANQAPQLPHPVSAWIATIAGSLSNVSVGGARAQLSDMWGGDAGSFCARAVNGRYPFSKNAKHEISVGDFARLFAPGGMLDNFFNTHLRPLVNTSGRQWHWQKVDNTGLGISDDVLAEFQRAAQIRDSFFADGGKQPHVAFQVTPISLDAQATGALFSAGGQQIEYQHGPQWPGNFQWPSQDATGVSRIVFEVPDGTPQNIMQTGAWSLFHLIDKGAVTRISDDAFRVVFEAGGHSATYEIRSSTALNPFILRELRAFRCPASF
jgi:type VI secretion system protein ImpL